MGNFKEEGWSNKWVGMDILLVVDNSFLLVDILVVVDILDYSVDSILLVVVVVDSFAFDIVVG